MNKLFSLLKYFLSKNKEELILACKVIALAVATYYFGQFLSYSSPVFNVAWTDKPGSVISSIIFWSVGYLVMAFFLGIAFLDWRDRSVPNIRYRLDNFNDHRGPMIREQDRIIHDFATDPKAFVQKHFNSHNSFLKHYLHKAYDGGDVNITFVLNSLIIPRRKTMNLDLLKTAMTGICNHVAHAYVDGAETDLFLDELNEKFEGYSDTAIAQLFCRPYNCFDYQDVLLLDQLAPNCKSIKELVHKSMVHTVHNKELIPGLKHQSFEFQVCITGKDYQQCSEVFSNCIYSSYIRNRSYDVVMVFHNGNPYACLTMTPYLKMTECLGVGNQKFMPREEEEIYQALWNAAKSST